MRRRGVLQAACSAVLALSCNLGASGQSSPTTSPNGADSTATGQPSPNTVATSAAPGVVVTPSATLRLVAVGGGPYTCGSCTPFLRFTAGSGGFQITPSVANTPSALWNFSGLPVCADSDTGVPVAFEVWDGVQATGMGGMGGMGSSAVVQASVTFTVPPPQLVFNPRTGNLDPIGVRGNRTLNLTTFTWRWALCSATEAGVCAVGASSPVLQCTPCAANRTATAATCGATESVAGVCGFGGSTFGCGEVPLTTTTSAPSGVVTTLGPSPVASAAPTAHPSHPPNADPTASPTQTPSSGPTRGSTGVPSAAPVGDIEAPTAARPRTQAPAPPQPTGSPIPATTTSPTLGARDSTTVGPAATDDAGGSAGGFRFGLIPLVPIVVAAAALCCVGVACIRRKRERRQQAASPPKAVAKGAASRSTEIVYGYGAGEPGREAAGPTAVNPAAVTGNAVFHRATHSATVRTRSAPQDSEYSVPTEPGAAHSRRPAALAVQPPHVYHELDDDDPSSPRYLVPVEGDTPSPRYLVPANGRLDRGDEEHYGVALAGHGGDPADLGLYEVPVPYNGTSGEYATSLPIEPVNNVNVDSSPRYVQPRDLSPPKSDGIPTDEGGPRYVTPRELSPPENDVSSSVAPRDLRPLSVVLNTDEGATQGRYSEPDVLGVAEGSSVEAVVVGGGSVPPPPADDETDL